MKGHTNNPNGRPRGVPNKSTNDLRKWVTKFVKDNRKTIQDDWKKLEPKDRIILFEKLLKYALPALQSSSLDINFSKLTDQQLDEIVNRLIEASE